ncbi:MAG: hypothetical protein H7227_04730 [Actinobacteria bacterium]|nr:hypothetical protein [Actinomycetota bacterium]
MLGGNDNWLFLQGLGGVFVLLILIYFLKWAFPSKKDPLAKAERRALQKSLRELKRK